MLQFFHLECFQITFPYLHIVINLKEINCRYDLLASIKLAENKILPQILGGKKMGRQRTAQNTTNPPTHETWLKIFIAS